MISAGIDIGAKTVKVVLVRDGEVLARSKVSAGIDTRAANEEAMDKAMAAADIGRGDIEKFLATGTGRKECPYTDSEVTEVGAAARGARAVLGSCHTVIDVGAEEGRSMRLNDKGKVLDFAFNEKCAAGAGAFAEAMARALETNVEELGAMALESNTPVPMNAQCAVFAESEVVTLIHAKTPRQDIARAVLDAIASRIVSMVRKVGFEKDVVVIGGVALNPGFIAAVKRGLEMDVYVPEEPEYVGALGAALLAAEQ
ncbi:MAG: CoA activase [Candidatus Krumholzibacteria bacterium]|nr:CoA activase [Candidatus Krumholzibacteria bacterium]